MPNRCLRTQGLCHDASWLECSCAVGWKQPISTHSAEDKDAERPGLATKRARLFSSGASPSTSSAAEAMHFLSLRVLEYGPSCPCLQPKNRFSFRAGYPNRSQTTSHRRSTLEPEAIRSHLKPKPRGSQTIVTSYERIAQDFGVNSQRALRYRVSAHAGSLWPLGRLLSTLTSEQLELPRHCREWVGTGQDRVARRRVQQERAARESSKRENESLKKVTAGQLQHAALRPGLLNSLHELAAVGFAVVLSTQRKYVQTFLRQSANHFHFFLWRYL